MNSANQGLIYCTHMLYSRPILIEGKDQEAAPQHARKNHHVSKRVQLKFRHFFEGNNHGIDKKLFWIMENLNCFNIISEAMTFMMFFSFQDFIDIVLSKTQRKTPTVIHK